MSIILLADEKVKSAEVSHTCIHTLFYRDRIACLTLGSIRELIPPRISISKVCSQLLMCSYGRCSSLMVQCYPLSLNSCISIESLLFNSSIQNWYWYWQQGFRLLHFRRQLWYHTVWSIYAWPAVGKKTCDSTV